MILEDLNIKYGDYRKLGTYINDWPLFGHYENPRKPMTVGWLSTMVQEWCRKIKLRGNYGGHTLRKTWGYHQRVTYGVDITVLMQCFNHANQSTTMRYLCIQPEEIKAAYMNQL